MPGLSVVTQWGRTRPPSAPAGDTRAASGPLRSQSWSSLRLTMLDRVWQSRSPPFCDVRLHLRLPSCGGWVQPRWAQIWLLNGAHPQDPRDTIVEADALALQRAGPAVPIGTSSAGGLDEECDGNQTVNDKWARRGGPDRLPRPMCRGRIVSHPASRRAPSRHGRSSGLSSLPSFGTLGPFCCHHLGHHATCSANRHPIYPWVARYADCGRQDDGFGRVLATSGRPIASLAPMVTLKQRICRRRRPNFHRSRSLLVPSSVYRAWRYLCTALFSNSKSQRGRI